MIYRVIVGDDELQKVYSELKEDGLTLNDISERIGADIRNHLYKNTSFTQESFEKLVELYGEDIEHVRRLFIDGRGFTEGLEIALNQNYAELVGLILGDGHIDKHSRDRGDRHITSYYVSVTLHDEEIGLIRDTIGLFSQCLEKSPNIENIKSAKAITLRVYGKEIVAALEETGLGAGNKVEKQVSVPEWIKRGDEELKTACLRGLVDTDGSVYVRSEDGYRVVHFKNRSNPLLNDFSKLCEDIGVKVSEAGEYAVQIAAERDVQKFLDKVEPRKKP